MKQSKRYIRNTVFALFGATVLVTAATRLYASAVDADTPRWLWRVMSLGLVVEVHRIPVTQVVKMVDAGQLHFSRISVEGDFSVDVIAAPLHKVSLIKIDGQAGDVGMEMQDDGLLKLIGRADSQGAVLRIEAPALTSIEARDLRLLRIRGWQVPALSVRVKNVSNISLEESPVERWAFLAQTPVSVNADVATLSAGYDIRADGQISIRGAGGQKFEFHGAGGHISVHTNK